MYSVTRTIFNKKTLYNSPRTRRSRSRSRSQGSHSRSRSYSSSSTGSTSRSSRSSRRKRKVKRKKHARSEAHSPPPARVSDKYSPYKTEDKFSPYKTEDNFPYKTEDKFSPYKSETMAASSSQGHPELPPRDRKLSSGHESISSDELPYFSEEPEPMDNKLKRKRLGSGSSGSSGSLAAKQKKQRKDSISSSELIASPKRIPLSPTFSATFSTPTAGSGSGSDSDNIPKPPMSPAGGSSISSGE